MVVAHNEISPAETALENPFFSVVVPAYNAAAYIEETLQSVLRQTYQNFEIIVVDDCSTDATGEIALALARQSPKIRYLPLAEPSYGYPAVVRNTGIRAAKGDWICFLDADDVWRPEKLDRVAAAAAKRPEAAIVHHDQVPFRDGTVWGKGYLASLPNFSPQALSGFCFESHFLENGFCTSSVAVRKRVLERVGYFDETLRMAEDYDLWLRVTASYPVMFLNEELAYYRLHETNMSGNTIGLETWVFRVLAKAQSSHSRLVRQIPAHRLRKRYARTHACLAYHYIEGGNAELAKKHYFRAARLHPTKLGYWLRGAILFDGGQLRRGLKRVLRRSD